jgi:hypothetical protein
MASIKVARSETTEHSVQLQLLHSEINSKKGEVHPRTHQEDPEEE